MFNIKTPSNHPTLITVSAPSVTANNANAFLASCQNFGVIQHPVSTNRVTFASESDIKDILDHFLQYGTDVEVTRATRG